MESLDVKELEAKGEVSAYEGVCHDCGCGVNLSCVKLPGGKTSSSGGAMYRTRDGMSFKCEECFSRQKTLKDHQECEVYSRVVGYLRPISQWNKGKLAEYDKREMLKF